MYTYPEALDAMVKVVADLFKAAGKINTVVTVAADAITGTASVDWQDHGSYMTVNVHMPVLPATYRMSEKEFARWAAYAFHEVGHPLDTDNGCWAEAVRTGRHRLLNALEDVRMEKRQIERNIAANGQQVLTDLVEGLMIEAEAGGFDINDPRNIGWTMAYLGRAKCNGYALDAERFLKGLNPQGPVAKVLEWAIPALKACRSTRDCLDLADRIVAALPDKVPFDEPDIGQPKGKGEPGDGESQPGESEDGASTEKADDKNKAQPSNRGGKVDPDAEHKPLDPKDVRDMPLAPKSDEALREGSLKQVVEAQVINVIRSAGRNPKRSVKPLDVLDDGTGRTLVGKAGKASRQRALLARALKANDDDAYEGGRNRGRLDRHAFAKIAAGQINVFGKRTVNDGYEADVEVLVDGSGSMNGPRAESAATLALVVSQAAAQVGVQCHVHMFCGGTLYEVQGGRSRPVAGKFGRMLHLPGGGTPLSVSIVKVAQLQAERAPAKRRILFTVTDGGCEKGTHVVESIVKYVEDGFGTEIANLGIGIVNGAFRNEVLVPDGGDVTRVGLERLTRILEMGR